MIEDKLQQTKPSPSAVQVPPVGQADADARVEIFTSEAGSIGRPRSATDVDDAENEEGEVEEASSYRMSEASQH
ncbi:hypothetical protein [Caballeronia calidae]|uniref:hypothetical protein n=1 Tax=Caballeronia calidae TaxID=1777139 RepID=UPI0012FD3C28|nr:hypothetical protein [Caballeronia calidae]